MKLLLGKEKFLEKLSFASRFSSSRFSSLSSLQGVLLEQKNDKLHFYATNLNSFYHSTIKTQESGEFKCVIDPKKILEFLNFLNPTKITIEITEKELLIIQEKNHASFPLMSPGDFPLPPKISEEKHKISTTLLTQNLPYVVFAASQDETRPVLNGVNFTAQDEEFLIVATDGFRLSLLKEKRDLGIPSIIVPREFLQEVMRFIKDEKEVGFGYSPEEKAIVFEMGDNKLYSRLIEGEFPPFDKVIPIDKKTTITCDYEELLRAIKLVSVFARDASNIIVFECNKKGVFLRPKTEIEGKNEAYVDGELQGDDQIVAFNFKFLLEFLNNVTSKRITIELLRPDAPVVFKTSDKKNFLHIIMPIRIQQ